nr:MAG TPA: hypothetical protein [Caudoviricetes sp.]
MLAIATTNLNSLIDHIHLYKHPTVRHRSIGVST